MISNGLNNACLEFKGCDLEFAKKDTRRVGAGVYISFVISNGVYGERNLNNRISDSSAPLCCAQNDKDGVTSSP